MMSFLLDVLIYTVTGLLVTYHVESVNTAFFLGAVVGTTVVAIKGFKNDRH